MTRKNKSTQEKHDSEGDDRGTPGGYMAIYHDIEEICYGPECGFPGIMRVFLCIKHNLLEMSLCQKPIGRSLIIEKTGLVKHQIIAAMKKLEKMGIIIVSQDKINPVWKNQYGENVYELNPEKLGLTTTGKK